MVKYALLIGINYKNTPIQLQGCINDISNMRQFLQYSLGYTIFITLTDDTPSKPTRKNILTAFNLLIGSLKSGDEAFVAYSGHGLLVADYNGDEVSGADSAIVPIDFLTAGIISDDVIRTNIAQRVPKGVKMYMVLDACHSGTGCDLRYKVDDSSTYNKIDDSSTINPSLPTTYIPSEWTLKQTTSEFLNYKETSGEVYCISGCQDEQTSEDAYIESEQTFNGALTYILLSILKSSNLKTLKWNELLEAICCNERIKGYAQITSITSGRPIIMESPVFTFPVVPIKTPIPPKKGKGIIKIQNKNTIMKKMVFI
jgi:hypothetical protein